MNVVETETARVLPVQQNPGKELALWLGPVILLWGLVAWQIGTPLWSSFPDFAYGWCVPFLAFYLLWERWKTRPTPAPSESRLWPWIIGLVAATFLPVRILQEANLIWLLLAWIIAMQAVVLGLALIYQAGGRPWLRHFWFPAVFFLISIPWPGPLGGLISGTMARMNTAATVEMLSLWGIPVLQQGRVIQIFSGVVGIDEACSGIRSFHAVLMLSLFFGEMHRLLWLKRIALVIGAVVMAFGFNIVRTFVLVWIAENNGLPAMEEWHDSTGVAILLVCFLALWGWSSWWHRREARGAAPGNPAHASLSRPAALTRLTGIAVVVWLGLVEVTTEVWYRAHEGATEPSSTWTVNLPDEKQDFREAALTSAVQNNLKFTEARAGRWNETDGTRWELFYFRWAAPTSRSERAWVQRATGHHPERCLSGVGMKLQSDLGTRLIPVKQFIFPFRTYVFDSSGKTAHVFFCIWHDDTPEQVDAASRHAVPMHPRVASAWTGNRSLRRGLRTVEFAVWGYPDEERAQASVQAALEEFLGSEGGE